MERYLLESIEQQLKEGIRKKNSRKTAETSWMLRKARSPFKNSKQKANLGLG